MLFAARLHALREGRIAFVEFYGATRNLWRYMGQRLLRQRNPGIGVGEEDVAQELVVAAWRAIPRWDPSRGVGIDRYVMFNACTQASHWLDSQREACQGARLRDNPNRCPVLGRQTTLEWEMSGADANAALSRSAFHGSAPTQVDGADAARIVLPRWATGEDRVVVEALVQTRSPTAAALLIYNHYPYRIAFELGNENAAARLVRRVATRLCGEPAFIRSLEENEDGY